MNYRLRLPLEVSSHSIARVAILLLLVSDATWGCVEDKAHAEGLHQADPNARASAVRDSVEFFGSPVATETECCMGGVCRLKPSDKCVVDDLPSQEAQPDEDYRPVRARRRGAPGEPFPDDMLRAGDQMAWLFDHSDTEIVALGTVSEATALIPAGERLPFTRCVLQAEQVFKGPVQRTITFYTPGGSVGGVTFTLSHMPKCAVGERALFFAWRLGERLTAVGSDQLYFSSVDARLTDAVVTAVSDLAAHAVVVEVP